MLRDAKDKCLTMIVSIRNWNFIRNKSQTAYSPRTNHQTIKLPLKYCVCGYIDFKENWCSEVLLVFGIKCYMKAKPTHSSELGAHFCDYPEQGLPLSAAGSAHPNSFCLILKASHKLNSLCVSNRRAVSLLEFALQDKVTKESCSLLSQCALQSNYTLNFQTIQHRQLYCYEKVLKMYTLQNLLYLSQS